MMGSSELARCVICGVSLVPPYVICRVCEAVNLCKLCFSRGSENRRHKNDHAYSVYREDFPLFESSVWTAAEELRLLEAVLENGFGNWVEIAKSVQSKDAGECSRHYERFYIMRPQEALPQFSHDVITASAPPLVCRYGDRPVRPSPHSLLLSEMAGYMPARGDFASEFDNYAELDLRMLDFNDDDDDFDTELKTAVLHVYHHKLNERQRRKIITRDYGLINFEQVAQVNRRYASVLKAHQLETLKKFWRLLAPVEADLFMESLMFESELRQDIHTLQKYRVHGLKRLGAAAVFDKLKSRKDNCSKRRHKLSDVVSRLQDKNACQRWLMSQPAVAAATGKNQVPLVPLPSAPRKAAPPMDVSGLPCFELLTPKEQEVCSNVRLVPKVYLDIKRILVSESKKLGSLRLAQARELIKIDVNKTRKLFDFLSVEGYIVKEG